MAMYSPGAGRYSRRGLSHSEISGSKPVSGSPKLFAAVHVLHRLSLPRHSPYALCSLALSLRHASRSLGFPRPSREQLGTPFDSQGHKQDSNRERQKLVPYDPDCAPRLLSRCTMPCSSSLSRVGDRARSSPVNAAAPDPPLARLVGVEACRSG